MSSKQRKDDEKLKVASVEPFPKIRYAELAVYLGAVVLGLVYLSAPSLIPTSVMLVVFAACLIAAVAIRLIWLKQCGTKKFSATLLTVLLAVCAAMTVAAAVLYFTSLK